jgi:hypothetical protein
MSAHKTVKVCDVDGCDKPSERSFSIKKVEETDLKLKSADLKQVHLCKEHYKAFKKQTKGDIPDYLGSIEE